MSLPIHFFTIVLNGEPFIRYHERLFSKLDVRWHWHIVEGVASLSHDTAWSVQSGGHISDECHNRGRSNDGTSEYLDDLARRMPENVTIYRKPVDEFWDGKREMCNAPLKDIKEECLLWQIDSDELWTADQINSVHKKFCNHHNRAAADYWCHYFVGPRQIISTRYNYAQNPMQEWRRTWRFKPGDCWLAHEPPTLGRPTILSRLASLFGIRLQKTFDVREIGVFTQDEMEAAGAIFQHFAYATEDQLKFKEKYYGYKGALEKWHALQAHKGHGLLRDYFDWVNDNCAFDDVAAANVVPLAWRDADTWRFGDHE